MDIDLQAIVSTPKDIFGMADTQYRVPLYQRGYSWTKQETEEFWNDLLDSFPDPYFLGSIVVNTEDKSVPEIIDGQQRLSSITILLCAVRDKYRAIGEPDRASRLQTNYIENAGIPGEEYFKLQMNGPDAEFIVSYVLLDTEDQRKKEDDYRKAKRKLRASNRRIWDASRLFLDGLGVELAKHDSQEDKIRFLDEFPKYLITQITFIRIGVGSPAQAFVVFETLNDRGLSLSVADLLKNSLFAQVAAPGGGPGQDDKIQEIAAAWETLTDTLPGGTMTAFLRHYWSSCQKLVRKDSLFDEYRSHVRRSADPSRFLSELRAAADVYATFLDPDQEKDAGVRQVLSSLRMLKATQCYSLLLSAWKMLDTKGFLAVARLAELLTLRHSTVCNRSARDLERIYHGVAKDIHENGANALPATVDKLRSLMPSDEEFVASFKSLEVRPRASQARYLLTRLEAHLGTGEKEAADSEKVHLEHIMPQTLSEEWKETLGEEVDIAADFINWLGNMTLLGSKLNAQASNAPFTEKRDKYYCQSEFALTKQLRDYDAWGLDQIGQRQNKLAEMARCIWAVETFIDG